MKPLRASLASGPTKLNAVNCRKQNQSRFFQSPLLSLGPSPWILVTACLKHRPYHLYIVMSTNRAGINLTILKIKFRRREPHPRQNSTAHLVLRSNQPTSAAPRGRWTILLIMHCHPTTYCMLWRISTSSMSIPGAQFFTVALPWILFSGHLHWMKLIRFFSMQLWQPP